MRIKEIKYVHLIGIDNTRKNFPSNFFKESCCGEFNLGILGQQRIRA